MVENVRSRDHRRTIPQCRGTNSLYWRTNSDTFDINLNNEEIPELEMSYKKPKFESTSS